MSACVPGCKPDDKTVGHVAGCAYAPEPLPEQLQRRTLLAPPALAAALAAAATGTPAEQIVLAARIPNVPEHQPGACSCGSTHPYSDGPGGKHGGGKLPKGTKPKVRKWSLKP